MTILPRPYVLWSGLIVAIVMISVVTTIAVYQWKPFAPKDYERCAEDAAKSAKSKDAFAVLMSLCRSDFVGRRRLGGGYMFYDSRQDRQFAIAGPNPTPQEMEYINKQYEIYVEKEREAEIAQARLRAEKERDVQIRATAATKQIKVQLLEAKCVSVLGCKDFIATMRVTNRSTEEISGIVLGWSFIPNKDQTKTAEDCPNSPQNVTEELVDLKPGGTAVSEFEEFIGPSSWSDDSICIQVTNVRIAD